MWHNWSQVQCTLTIERGFIKMKFKITYFVHGMIFEAIAYGVTDAFDYVKAIIKAEKLMYPNQQEAFDDYFEIIGDMARAKGDVSSFSAGSGLFKIEIISAE